MPSPDHPRASTEEASMLPLRAKFPPLTPEEWFTEMERFKSCPIEVKIAASFGLTVERARELLKRTIA